MHLNEGKGIEIKNTIISIENCVFENIIIDQLISGSNSTVSILNCYFMNIIGNSTGFIISLSESFSIILDNNTL